MYFCWQTLVGFYETVILYPMLSAYTKNVMDGVFDKMKHKLKINDSCTHIEMMYMILLSSSDKLILCPRWKSLGFCRSFYASFSGCSWHFLCQFSMPLSLRALPLVYYCSRKIFLSFSSEEMKVVSVDDVDVWSVWKSRMYSLNRQWNLWPRWSPHSMVFAMGTWCIMPSNAILVVMRLSWGKSWFWVGFGTFLQIFWAVPTVNMTQNIKRFTSYERVVWSCQSYFWVKFWSNKSKLVAFRKPRNTDHNHALLKWK